MLDSRSRRSIKNYQLYGRPSVNRLIPMKRKAQIAQNLDELLETYKILQILDLRDPKKQYRAFKRAKMLYMLDLALCGGEGYLEDQDVVETDRRRKKRRRRRRRRASGEADAEDDSQVYYLDEYGLAETADNSEEHGGDMPPKEE